MSGKISASTSPAFGPAYQQLYSTAQKVAATPYQQYQGQMLAPINGAQQTAMEEVGSLQGLPNDFINAAQNDLYGMQTPLTNGVAQVGQGTLGALPGSAMSLNQQSTGNLGNVPGYSASTIQSMESPYTQSVVNATQNQFANTNAQQQQQLVGSAVSSGAWGGDRAAVAQGVLGGQQAAAQAPVIAGLQNQGFMNAQQEANTQQQLALQKGTAQSQLQQSAAAQQLGLFSGQQQMQLGANEAHGWLGSQAAFGEANLGNTALNSNLTAANALLGVGNQMQGQTQQGLNIPYEQFLAKQAYPFQTTGWLSNIAQGVGGLAGGSSETTYPGPSAVSTGLGVAGIAAGAAGQYFGRGGNSGGNTLGGYAGSVGSIGGGYGGNAGGSVGRGGIGHRAAGGTLGHFATGGMGGSVPGSYGGLGFGLGAVGAGSGAGMGSSSSMGGGFADALNSPAVSAGGIPNADVNFIPGDTPQAGHGLGAPAPPQVPSQAMNQLGSAYGGAGGSGTGMLGSIGSIVGGLGTILGFRAGGQVPRRDDGGDLSPSPPYVPYWSGKPSVSPSDVGRTLSDFLGAGPKFGVDTDKPQELPPAVLTDSPLPPAPAPSEWTAAAPSGQGQQKMGPEAGGITFDDVPASEWSAAPSGQGQMGSEAAGASIAPPPQARPRQMPPAAAAPPPSLGAPPSAAGAPQPPPAAGGAASLASSPQPRMLPPDGGQGFGLSQEELPPARKPDPWMALMAAGAGTLAGSSPYAMVNLGRGALAGLQEYATDRREGEQERHAQFSDQRAGQELFANIQNARDRLKMDTQHYADQAENEAARNAEDTRWHNTQATDAQGRLSIDAQHYAAEAANEQARIDALNAATDQRGTAAAAATNQRGATATAATNQREATAEASLRAHLWATLPSQYPLWTNAQTSDVIEEQIRRARARSGASASQPGGAPAPLTAPQQGASAGAPAASAASAAPAGVPLPTIVRGDSRVPDASQMRDGAIYAVPGKGLKRFDAATKSLLPVP